MKDDLYDAVSKIAYELHEKRGRQHGYDLDDWLEAEKIVLARREKSIERAVERKKQKIKKTKMTTAHFSN